MKNNISSPDGFCANVKDVGLSSTYWRGKNKSKKQIQKDTKIHQNVG
jgi:hypothetical protein